MNIQSHYSREYCHFRYLKYSTIIDFKIYSFFETFVNRFYQILEYYQKYTMLHHPKLIFQCRTL